ncbi:MAG: hypothetical protein II261_11755 [Bacteroidaceae bacterium]|nr:hypothetical protein [Bacteroidaceae bacterium]
MKTQLKSRKSPVAKILFLNWKKIFSQLGNNFFPVGRFKASFYWVFFALLALKA